jgi:hypothetical protein
MAQLSPVPERKRSRQFNVGPAMVELAGDSVGTVGFVDGGVPALNGIYVAVRDRDWGTVPGCVLRRRVKVDEGGFEVALDVSHRANEISFGWHGRIKATASGPASAELSFSMEGTAENDFLANRVGFCLLHPLGLSGQQVEVWSASGCQVSQFPVDIAAHQPFSDLVRMSYALGPTGRCTISFKGELFETEDQRNWTDASYKTYCTPLRLPYPRMYRRAEKVNQEIFVQLQATGRRDARGPRRPTRGAVQVSVGPLAEVVLPPIGTEHTTGAVVPDKKRLALLRYCGLDHLRAVADLSGPSWPGHISAAAATADALSARLEIEAVVTGTRGLKELVSALRPLGVIGRLLVFDRTTSVTTRELIVATRRALARAGARVDKVAGGSRANFAELNRADLPVDLLDEVAVSFNPQVHAFDDASIMSTLPVQPIVVSNAQRIAGGRPVLAGPVTLRPRFNPVATTPSTLATTATEGSHDPRQMSLFAAAWTLGSIACLSFSGVPALTYHGLLGGRGLAAWRTEHAELGLHPRAVYPIFHVFAELAAMRDRHLRSVRVSEPDRVAVLAGGDDTRPWLALANLRPTSTDVVVRMAFEQPGQLTVKHVDQTAASAGLTEGGWRLLHERVHGLRKLKLQPYEVVFVEPELPEKLNNGR